MTPAGTDTAWQPEPTPIDADRVASLVEERRPLKAATIALVLLACLVSAIVLSWSVFHSRTLELSNALSATSNTAHSLAEQANSSFKMADTVLVSLVDNVEVEGWQRVDLNRLRNLMVKHVAQLPALQGLFIYNETGRWMVNSAGREFDGRNNGDRAYFQFHKNNPSRDVHIGRPIVGRTSGVWVIPVSRRINHADGSFAGVALATIKVDYFRKVYESLEIGRDWKIMMAHNDGAVLLRVPYSVGAIGYDVGKHPAYRMMAKLGFPNRTGETKLDNIDRLYSYARVGNYPVGVVILRDRSEVLRPWLQSASLAYTALILLVAGLLLLGRRVITQLALREQLQHELLATKAQLEAANSSLSTMAYIDGLTELFNRRYYEQVFERELRRASRHQTSIAVLMIDVDCFKKFNDRYGHPVGDDCLRVVARTIKSAMRRSSDFAARYGGEEFVVILPDTDLAGAQAVAESIRAGVEERAIVNAESPYGLVTVSIGIHAAVPQHGEAGGHFVGGADAALYRAKAQGRNRALA